MDNQIVDPVFGKLTSFKGLMWEGRLDMDLLRAGAQSFDLETEKAPDDQLRALFMRFRDAQAEFKPILQEALFTHYQSLCDEWRELLEEDAEKLAPFLHTSDQIWALLSDPTLLLYEQSPDRPDLQGVELHWNATWDQEHGLGVKVLDGQGDRVRSNIARLPSLRPNPALHRTPSVGAAPRGRSAVQSGVAGEHHRYVAALRLSPLNGWACG